MYIIQKRAEHEKKLYFLRTSRVRGSTTFPVLNFGVRKVVSLRAGNEVRGCHRSSYLAQEARLRRS